MIPNFFDGRFFVFEGADGCGKSEQLKRAEEWIRQQNVRRWVVKTNKEPNKEHEEGKKIYVDLAKQGGVHETNPMGFQTWYARDRKMNLREIIIPALKVGSIVLSDRYCPSMVFGVFDMNDMEKLMTMQKEVIGEDFIWPDATFIFDVSVNTTLERLKKKNRELDQYERGKIIERVRLNYMAYAQKYSGCYLINAERSPEKISEDVVAIMLPFLEKIRGRVI